MIITVTNQKGGVAKTTTTHSLGFALGNKNKKILLVDIDAQGNLSEVVLSSPPQTTIYDVLVKGVKIENVVINYNEYIDIVPANLQLAALDLELTCVGKEHKLKEALESIKNNYDYIIIDTPPALGIATVNALTASDEVIITAQADMFSLAGIGQLYKTIESVKKYCNASLKILGILFTRFNSRTRVGKEALEAGEKTAKMINTKIFNTKISECTVIKEAQANKKNIFDFAKNSKAAKEYLEFTEEFLKNIPYI